MDQTPIENEPLEAIAEETNEVLDQVIDEPELSDADKSRVVLPAEGKVPSGKRFTLSINTTKEDFFDALKHINKINWMTWATMGMFIVIMAVVLLMSLTDSGGQGTFNLLWSVGLILVAIFMLVNGLYLNPKRLATKLAAEPSLLQSGTLTLDDNGLLDSRSTTGKTIPWTIFKDMFETDRSYLLMSAANRGAYQVLPKHSFTNAKEADKFRAFALKKLPKASLRRLPLQIFPLIMFLLSIGMLVWVLLTRMQ